LKQTLEASQGPLGSTHQLQSTARRGRYNAMAR
jgi:hypothetical protein